MSYTTDRYSRLKKRSERDDLLKDTEDTFYGGGTAQPRPTPTPTPRPTVLAMNGNPTGLNLVPNITPKNLRTIHQEAANNAAGILQLSSVFPTAVLPGSGGASAGQTSQYALKHGQLDPRGVTQVQLPSGGFAGYRTAVPPTGDPVDSRFSRPAAPVSNSYYIDKSGTNLGPQYGKTGSVNPLPSGAVGVQGSRGFNTSLNGVQPQAASVPTPSRPSTPSELALDIATRNHAATQPQQDDTNLPSNVQKYISPEEASKKGLQWTGGNQNEGGGWQPYVSPQQMTEQNLMYTGGPSSGSVNVPSQTTKFLPPGFTTAVGQTGAANSSPNDVHFLPPGFTSVQGTVGQNKQLQFLPPGIKKEDEGYGSAYGY